MVSKWKLPSSDLTVQTLSRKETVAEETTVSICRINPVTEGLRMKLMFKTTWFIVKATGISCPDGRSGVGRPEKGENWKLRSI
jgi:hypothetical protein